LHHPAEVAWALLDGSHYALAGKFPRLAVREGGDVALHFFGLRLPDGEETAPLRDRATEVRRLVRRPLDQANEDRTSRGTLVGDADNAFAQ
jgi:hypothetical protein